MPKNNYPLICPKIIPVSYIAKQFWCEMELDLMRRHGKINTPEMEKGQKIHNDLLLEIGEVIPVEIKTPADKLRMITHNILAGIKQFKKKGITREFPIFLKFNSVFIPGFIDEIIKIEEDDGVSMKRKRKKKAIRLIETKTRTVNKRPFYSILYRDKMQGMVYHYGLNSMINNKIDTEECCAAFGINTETVSDDLISLDVDEKGNFEFKETFCLGDMMDVEEALEEVTKLPELSDNLEIRYIFQENGEEIYRETFKFDHNSFFRNLNWASGYWVGKRDPVTVREQDKWKCRYCDYAEKCPSY